MAPLSGHQSKLKCEECQSGRYVESAGVCAKCSPGKFQNCCKRDACLPCGNHTFCAEEGCDSCEVCPAGTYSTDPTNAVCKQCPVCDGQKSIRKGEDGMACMPATGADFCNEQRTASASAIAHLQAEVFPTIPFLHCMQLMDAMIPCLQPAPSPEELAAKSVCTAAKMV